MKEFDQNVSEEELEEAARETSVIAYRLARSYTALWKAGHNNASGAESLFDPILSPLTRQFTQDLSSIFADPPMSESLPAPGHTFGRLFLAWLRHFTREDTFEPSREEREPPPPPRRCGGGQKSARRQPAKNEMPQE